MSTGGTYHSLSLPRRWICDLVALSKTIPIAALEHRLNLKPLIEARNALESPPSWVVLFLKAFAIVAKERKALRQFFVGFPWPRIYEHPVNVAAITVERDYKGEPSTFFDMLLTPEVMSFEELHEHLRKLKHDPVEVSRTFKLMIQTARFPLPIRRMVWRWLYSFSGPRRAHYMGTFAINGGGRYPIRPVTIIGAVGTTLYFGLFDADGSTDVCLTFDHRVMDGGEVIRSLLDLEVVMNTVLVEELKALAPSTAATERVH